MDNESCESSDTVTLVLQDSHVKANKNKLARCSLYFASLFSENFKDHRQKEFVINYEVSPTSLQDFVDWTNDDGDLSNSIDFKKYSFTVKRSLEKFLTWDLLELLKLLNLSVIFMAEKLTEDIIEMIIYMRLPPDDMLEVWLLAENLSLKGLECVALATCLDRFDELSEASLVDLPLEHFSKLLCNVNVRSSPERLMNVRDAWIERNGLIADMPDSSLRFIKGEPETVMTVLKKATPHYVQCVGGHKLNKTQFIYCWNGETLHELAEIGKEIIGERVVARGFNIYVVGRIKGEDIKTCHPTIWRFCVFTKKWYTETLLPRNRCHVEVAFLKNKLYVFGGSDPTELQIDAVDVYNVHNGVWSTAADIPQKLRCREPESSCAVDGKILFRQLKSVSVYDPLTGYWTILKCPLSGCGPDYSNTKSVIGAFKSSDIDIAVMYLRSWQTTPIHDLGMTALAYNGYLRIVKIHSWDTPIIDAQLMNGPQLVSFGYSDGRARVEVGEVNHSMKEGEITASYHRTKIYSQDLHDVPATCFHQDLGCFNLIEPESLRTTIAIPVHIFQ